MMMLKLLFTGASGFLGYNIMPVLSRQYETVHTLGLTDRDEIRVDLASEVPDLHTRYDIVLHACGKAHAVPRTDAEMQMFYDVNYQGTVNLCRALERTGVPKALVFISTVAVYGCESGDLITEEQPRKGDTPYAASKIMAEDFLTGWCTENGVTLGILRPSLLAGRNPVGNLGAMVAGIRKGMYMNIAGGHVRKSVLMAEDIANLLPLVAEKGGVYNVCDSFQPTFRQLSDSVARQLGRHKPLSIPYWAAWCMAKVGDVIGRVPINSLQLEKMTRSLTFSNDKARRELGWEPLDVLTNFKIHD